MEDFLIHCIPSVFYNNCQIVMNGFVEYLTVELRIQDPRRISTPWVYVTLKYFKASI